MKHEGLNYVLTDKEWNAFYERLTHPGEERAKELNEFLNHIWDGMEVTETENGYLLDIPSIN